MFPWLAKEQSFLRDPKTRGNMRVNPDDRVFFSSCEKFSSVNYKILLDEVQRVERSIYKLKKNAGIKMIPCGESRDGIISGGSIEHIVEHAICAVMDLISPIDEASCGITEDVGGVGNCVEEIIMCRFHPPSISSDLGVQITNEVADKILLKNGKVNLEEIAREFKKD